ncbi:MAG: hypothetical protein ACRDYU_08535 [Actinomycetes bacterium]
MSPRRSTPRQSPVRDNGVRFTRRGRVVALVLVGGLTLGAGYAVRAVVTGPECTVRLADGTERTLTRAEAMAATTAAGARIGGGEATRLRGGDAVPARVDRAVTAALLGGRGALSCTAGLSDVADEGEGPSGLTPRGARLLDALEDTFGDQRVGGFAPGGVDSGHIEGSAHYEGRAVDVFFRPVTANRQRAGWAVAQWAVAHADRLDVATVIYDRRIWSSRWGAHRWRAYRPPGGATSNPTLLHLDHVHVDVH